MIRDWLNRLFGKTETERPPKPEKKQDSRTYKILTTTAWWPGSDGGVEVAFESHGQLYEHENWYKDFEIKEQNDNIPYIDGTIVKHSPETVTYENPTEVCKIKVTYTAEPYWAAYCRRWRFKPIPSTTTMEVIE